MKLFSPGSSPTFLAPHALLAVLFFFSVTGAFAGTPVLEASYTSQILNGWEKVERWRDPNSNFVQESFPTDGRGDQSGQRVRFFGEQSQPHSSRFLIYYAPGWNRSTSSTPVLLIHGANQDADIAWANPNDAGDYGCGRATCPSTGMMQALSAQGLRVFALSFAHKNGDGYLWAEAIADAIHVVKAQTGANKVDLVTWSKSAFNARMYVSSVTAPWGTNYRGDVRRLIMLGGPNNGIDWSFRHGWNHTFSAYPECGGAINGPTAHTAIVCYGLWRSGPQWSYGSAYFPGSAQLLKRWDSEYPLPASEQDWYTTYHGGTGYYTDGLGIAAYMDKSLIDDVRNAGTDAEVRVHNLCGSEADISLIHNEHTGPSDGVVFVASCRDTVGIKTHGGSNTVSVNHLELGWESLPVQQVIDWLSAP